MQCSFAKSRVLFGLLSKSWRSSRVDFDLAIFWPTLPLAYLFDAFSARVRLQDFVYFLDKCRHHLRFKLKLGTEKFCHFPCKNFLLAWPSPHCLWLASKPTSHPNSPPAATNPQSPLEFRLLILTLLGNSQSSTSLTSASPRPPPGKSSPVPCHGLRDRPTHLLFLSALAPPSIFPVSPHHPSPPYCQPSAPPPPYCQLVPARPSPSQQARRPNLRPCPLPSRRHSSLVPCPTVLRPQS